MSALPELPLASWRETNQALHLVLQVVGKVRMALHPKQNHWWHVPLYVGPRGFTTEPIPTHDRTLEIIVDVLADEVQFVCSTGGTRSVPLKDGLTVAGFHARTMEALAALGYTPEIVAKPYDPAKVGSDVPFAEDHTARPWDAEAVRRFWRILEWTNGILTTFRGRFLGKHSPVHFFWHSLDLAYTRFSGRAAPLEGGSASDREAYSHEVTSVGFWAGDTNVPAPAFYAYAYPEPKGLGETGIQPAAATWNARGTSHMGILMYDDVRTADDPRQAVVDFCESTYRAAADLADWDVAAFDAPWAGAKTSD